MLERIGDKWTLYVVHVLGGGTRRFSELQREIEGVTPRMLTVTVRNLERDGLVTRTVYRWSLLASSTTSPVPARRCW